MRIKDNPNGCMDERKRGNRTCIECYYSQVNERNQWTGSQRCWDKGECLVLRKGDE